MSIKSVDYLVVHCSATPASRDIGAAEIEVMHRQRGFRTIGYHYVIRRNGVVQKGRPDTEPGAHVSGYNQRSLGICLIGGVKADGKTAEANYTDAQYAALRSLLHSLMVTHPAAQVLGHRDLSPDKNGNGKVDPHERIKECPCFDVIPWWASKNQ